MRAYNVFRCKGEDAVLCAVPEDCAVPCFVTGRAWCFDGRLDQPAAAPVGFDPSAARASVRLHGFYLFHAFKAR